MVTPSDQVRRLRRVLDVLVALASVLDGRSRVVDGRVQLDLAALGPALKEQLGEPGFKTIYRDLAELFRCSDDRPLEIMRPRENSFGIFRKLSQLPYGRAQGMNFRLLRPLTTRQRNSIHEKTSPAPHAPCMGYRTPPLNAIPTPAATPLIRGKRAESEL